MIVTCHQPHFLPWVPYLNRLAHADLFIMLDDVAYRKNYFQNRTQIADADNRAYWVTAPVKRMPLGTPISQIRVLDPCTALTKSRNRLREVYRYYQRSEVLSEVLSILARPPARLLDLNMVLLHLVMQALSITRVQVVPVSKIVGPAPRHQRLLLALKEVNASSVIIGMGGMATVNDLASWREAGIKLAWQTPQQVPTGCSLAIGQGVSVLHDLVTSGSGQAAQIVKQFWTPDEP